MATDWATEEPIEPSKWGLRIITNELWLESNGNDENDAKPKPSTRRNAGTRSATSSNRNRA